LQRWAAARRGEVEATPMEALLPVAIVTGIVFGVALAGLGIGAMANRRCLRGSCGGAEPRTADGLSLRCMLCPRRRRKREAAREEQPGHGR